MTMPQKGQQVKPVVKEQGAPTPPAPEAKSRLQILEERIAALEGMNLTPRVVNLENLVAGLGGAVKEVKAGAKGNGGKKVLFGEHRERKAIKDVTTGIVYVSKSAVGKALAKEAGASADDHFAWYKLTAKFPGRFVDATPEEKAKVEAAEEARLKAEQEAEMAKLAAETKAAEGKPQG